MSNKQKAARFMVAWNANDPRCAVVLMMLSISFAIPETEELNRIKALAE